jgi:hypothetical protein
MARRPRRSQRRKRKVLPLSFGDLVKAGGPEAFVRREAKKMATAVAEGERILWLGRLERMTPPDDPVRLAIYECYVRDLRRKLRIKPPKDVIRAQTRERVRRLRARRRAAMAKQGPPSS